MKKATVEKLLKKKLTDKSILFKYYREKQCSFRQIKVAVFKDMMDVLEEAGVQWEDNHVVK